MIIYYYFLMREIKNYFKEIFGNTCNNMHNKSAQNEASIIYYVLHALFGQYGIMKSSHIFHLI